MGPLPLAPRAVRTGYCEMQIAEALAPVGVECTHAWKATDTEWSENKNTHTSLTPLGMAYRTDLVHTAYRVPTKCHSHTTR